jgi:hypothetical protein
MVWVFCGLGFGSYINEVFTYRIGLLFRELIYLLGGISFWFSKGKINW